MGGNRSQRGALATQRGVALILAVLAIAACGDADPVATNVVDTADAITAVIAWEVDEQEPVLDDDGEPLQPVIFVVPDGGATIDVGVQASVAAATVDWATVRFADNVTEAFDPAIEGEPVRENGAMLLIGPIPEPARSIELDVVRYTSVDDGEPLRLEITSGSSTDPSGDTPTLRASVTDVTRL
jgi:hypothetical protein